MSTGLYLNLRDAAVLADKLVTRLAPACEKIMIAGSVRRQRPHVHDIELLAEPKLQIINPRPVQLDMFDDDQPEPDRVSALELLLPQLLDQYASMRWPSNGALDGPKMKKFEVEISQASDTWVSVDLFITTSDQFEGMLLIRTGPAEFSRHMVTRAEAGGPLPPGWGRHMGPTLTRAALPAAGGAL